MHEPVGHRRRRKHGRRYRPAQRRRLASVAELLHDYHLKQPRPVWDLCGRNESCRCDVVVLMAQVAPRLLLTPVLHIGQEVAPVDLDLTCKSLEQANVHALLRRRAQRTRACLNSQRSQSRIAARTRPPR